MTDITTRVSGSNPRWTKNHSFWHLQLETSRSELYSVFFSLLHVQLFSFCHSWMFCSTVIMQKLECTQTPGLNSHQEVGELRTSGLALCGRPVNFTQLLWNNQLLKGYNRYINNTIPIYSKSTGWKCIFHILTSLTFFHYGTLLRFIFICIVIWHLFFLIICILFDMKAYFFLPRVITLASVFWVFFFLHYWCRKQNIIRCTHNYLWVQSPLILKGEINLCILLKISVAVCGETSHVYWLNNNHNTNSVPHHVTHFHKICSISRKIYSLRAMCHNISAIKQRCPVDWACWWCCSRCHGATRLWCDIVLSHLIMLIWLCQVIRPARSLRYPSKTFLLYWLAAPRTRIPMVVWWY